MNPWVDRQFGRTKAKPRETALVTIVIDGQLSDFDEQKRALLPLALAALLNLPPKHVRLVSEEEGSIRLTLDLPIEAAAKLKQLYERKDHSLMDFLASVTEADVASSLLLFPHPRVVKTVVEFDLIGYSLVCDNLEQNVDVRSVAVLNQQIQAFIRSGLSAINMPIEAALMVTTGDGAILVFDSAKDAYEFAAATHQITVEHNRTRHQPLAKRIFRSGAATGDLVIQPKPNGGFDMAGATISRAVRLEARADPGGLLIDRATYDELPPNQQAFFGPRKSVQGKRDESFVAFPCILNPDASRDAAYFQDSTPKDFPHDVSVEIGRGERRELVARLRHIRPHQHMELCFLLEMPIDQRSPDHLTLEEKASRLLQWADEHNTAGFLLDVLREITPPLAGCEMDAETASRLVGEAAKPARRQTIVRSLAAELPSRKDPTERYWIYVALGQIGGKIAANAVYENRGDPSEFARQGVAQAMAALASELKCVSNTTNVCMTPTIKPRVFISHSSNDKEFVRRLVRDLDRRELNLWLDERELKPGDSIVSGIEGGLRETDYLVVVLSRSSVRSRWVRAELDAALMDQLSRGGTVVLPSLIEDCDIPPLLRGKVYADFRQGYEAGLTALLTALDNESRAPKDFIGWGDPSAPKPHECVLALSKLTIGELRRRLDHRLERREVADMWFDVFNGEQMDDQLPNASKPDCIRHLLDRARKRNAFFALLAQLCSTRPDIMNP